MPCNYIFLLPGVVVMVHAGKPKHKGAGQALRHPGGDGGRGGEEEEG